MLRKSDFDNVPMKQQRVYQEMNESCGQDTCYVTTIGLSQIGAAQFLHVYQPRHWINAAQAGPLAGRSRPRSACARPIPTRRSSRSRATTTSSS